MNNTNVQPVYKYNTKQLSQKGGVVSTLALQQGSLINSKAQLQYRGLSPRYNAVYIDGILAPSTETSTKAFSFNRLPSSFVNSINVYTNGTAGVSGEFAGAAIDIHTKATVNKNFNTFSVNLVFLPYTTGQDFYTPQNYGGAADFFGVGVEKRNFSDDIASPDELQNMSRNEAALEAQKLENVWGVNKSKALPNMGLSYIMGRDLGGNRVKVSTVNGFTFNKSSKTYYGDRYGYTGYTTDDNGTVTGSKTKYYNDNYTYNQTTSTNLVSNWNFEFSPKSNITFSNYYSHTANNMFSVRYGLDYDNQYERVAYATDYIAKSMYLSRVNGHHVLGADEQTTLDWAAGYSHTTRKEPDYRVAAAQRLLGTTEDFYLLIPRSSKADAGSRYASVLKENTYSGRVDFTRNLSGNDNGIVLKAGVYSEYSARGFNSRLTSFAQDDNTDYELRYPSASEIGSIFESENFGENGYYMIDGTRPTDTYTADSKLLAEYVGLELPVAYKSKIGVGVRVESFNQTLVCDTVNVNNQSTDVLPYLNYVKADDKGGVLKMSYAKSINRPAFRELAPFTYYDFEWRTDIAGNSELENTEIQNIDFSYSKQFIHGLKVSGSLFYKYMNNPIEKAYKIRSESPMFTYENSESAQLAGVSLEVTTPLSANKHHWLNKVHVMVNASYIYSQVQLSEESQEATSTRALQGQAPYIINAAISYKHKDLLFAVMYNTQGKSLYTVGDGQETYPWYLMPTHNLGFMVKKTMTKKLDLSFKAANILNAKATFYEDGNMDGEIDLGNGSDKLIREVQVGPSFTFGLSVKF
ncbi:TonB-dependent receptor plug domain-containing protein [Flammeovirga kamogawensis]|uniref:TonB-dependent receptor n=1 Tax=Flammeovirga kamogawensis TaxID=373891 RepID=A0ABX8H2C3_9BACT|nr:TonB-dependent receptor [Flammeovirga kamogawensis]MBB6460163.1 hypothetical protein [Flammeovirga kamogawensis]QWG09975.1 TonB-dependent receptor [Flammeovirga kamogawensis]